jgi:hypothetical protein
MSINNILRRPFSLSYSRIKNYETCPRRYNEIDVLKNFKEEKTRELTDGFLVHDAMADRITSGTPLPPGMPFEKWIDYVYDHGISPRAETRLAITPDFMPCDYFDRVKPVWLRTVADVLNIDGNKAHIVDWKTGKVKPDLDQLMLIGTCVMVHYPEVFHLKADLVWLAHDTQTTREFTVDDIARFWIGDGMFAKVQALQEAHDKNHFPPRTSGLCKRYCVVTTCEHCGE